MTKMIICSKCGKENPYYSNKKLCKRCYMKQWNKNHQQYHLNWDHKTGRSKSMYKNKTCSNYLGIVIAEQILSKIFKDIEVMPNNHKGYDFKCNNGYLIDSKAGCKYSRGRSLGAWDFAIRKNKIPDYFLLLAFDNRSDLNPEHIWLIPGKVINNKSGIKISESQISKWNKYKLDINKVINECNIMKGDNSGII